MELRGQVSSCKPIRLDEWMGGWMDARDRPHWRGPHSSTLPIFHSSDPHWILIASMGASRAALKDG